MTLKDGNAGHALTFCPHCGSDQVWRILRSETEKIVSFLSRGQYLAKKYVCQGCQGTVLLHRNGIPFLDTKALEENRIEGLVACSNCGEKNLKVEGVSASQEISSQAETGKTAFKKINCTGCGHTATIYREDFEAFNKQEF